jgi:hypothetical protein
MLRFFKVTAGVILLLVLDVSLGSVILGGKPFEFRILDISGIVCLLMSLMSCAWILTVYILSRWIRIVPTQVYGVLGAAILLVVIIAIMGSGDMHRGIQSVQTLHAQSWQDSVVFTAMVIQCFWGATWSARL